jgi:hypothetical protein
VAACLGRWQALPLGGPPRGQRQHFPDDFSRSGSIVLEGRVQRSPASRIHNLKFGQGASCAESLFGGDFCSKLRAPHRDNGARPWVRLCVGLLMITTFDAAPKPLRSRLQQGHAGPMARFNLQRHVHMKKSTKLPTVEKNPTARREHNHEQKNGRPHPRGYFFSYFSTGPFATRPLTVKRLSRR